MKDDEQIRSLKIELKEVKRNIELLNTEMAKLKDDTNVAKYILLVEKCDDFNDSIYFLTSQIRDLERKECFNEHRVLFCTSLSNIDYEGKSYYNCRCLNCGEKMEVTFGNMEAHRIIDGRRYIRENNILVHDILNQATKKYHLLRDCYDQYPEILKENEKKDEMIYKVMRKKYEIT